MSHGGRSCGEVAPQAIVVGSFANTRGLTLESLDLAEMRVTVNNRYPTDIKRCPCKEFPCWRL